MNHILVSIDVGPGMNWYPDPDQLNIFAEDYNVLIRWNLPLMYYDCVLTLRYKTV